MLLNLQGNICLTVGLSHLNGLLQLKWFYDSDLFLEVFCRTENMIAMISKTHLEQVTHTKMIPTIIQHNSPATLS